MRIFLTRIFNKWAEKEKLSEEDLTKSVEEIENGLIDAVLGGSLFKKRIAKKGKGKSGGYRTILAYKEGDKIFFLYGFSKNERENINKKELKLLKALGNELLEYSNDELGQLLQTQGLSEIEEGE